jgi:hypothetical protein
MYNTHIYIYYVVKRFYALDYTEQDFTDNNTNANVVVAGVAGVGQQEQPPEISSRSRMLHMMSSNNSSSQISTAQGL